MPHLVFSLVPKFFIAACLLMGIPACANVTNEEAVKACIQSGGTAMELMNCEFKAMMFDVKTDIKEFTIAGEVQQIKRVQLAEPEKARAMLTALAQKHVEFKVIRILMPGTVVTMEYRDDRINFQFDESGLPKLASRG